MMQIMLQITADSPSEMMKVLAAFEKAQSLADQPELQFPPSAAQNGGATPKRRGRPPREMDKLVEVPAPKLKVVEETPEKIVVAPAPEPEPEPPQPAPPKQEITIVEVRNALTQFLARTDQKQASALLLQYGKTDRLSKLKREQFEAVYNAAMTPAAKDPFDDDIPDLTA